MGRELGVSVVSMGPQVRGEHGPFVAVDIMYRAKFDGLFVLPLKGWHTVPTQKVIGFETAWNQGTFMDAVHRTIGHAGEEKPTLLDWFLFGANPLGFSWLDSHLPSSAMFVTHDREDTRGAYEINPESGMPKRRCPLVIDTLHIRRQCRGTNRAKPLPRWDQLVAIVAGDTALVHVHPGVREIKDLLKGRGEISKIIRELVLRTPKDVPMILEVAPPVLGTRETTVRYLSALREGMLKAMYNSSY